MILRRDDPHARVVVPDHASIRPGTLRRIIADAGLTVDQFLKLSGGWVSRASTGLIRR
jgi:hypothetical protein